jgi:hypothetical protein
MKQVKEDVLISEAYSKVYEDIHPAPNVNTDPESEYTYGRVDYHPRKDAHLERMKKASEQDEISNANAESMCEINASQFPMSFEDLSNEAQQSGLKIEKLSKVGKPSGNRDVASYYQIKLSGAQGELDAFVDNLHQQYGSKGFEQIS